MLEWLKRTGVTLAAIKGWLWCMSAASAGLVYFLGHDLPTAELVPLAFAAFGFCLIVVSLTVDLYKHLATGKYRQKPDYEKWDSVDWLAEWQAACLWDDIEPYSPVADRTPSYPTLQRIKSAAMDGLLGEAKIYPGEEWTRYSRNAFRNFARFKGIRPLAFFPEVRGRDAVLVKSTPLTTSVIRDMAPPMETQVTSLDKFLYIGRMETSADKILSDYELRFDAIGFNGSNSAISNVSVTGKARYRLDGQPNYVELPPAQFLKLHWNDPVGPYSEFVIELSQHVSGKIANDISDALARGAIVEFELLELHVSIKATDSNIVGKVPIWPGIRCAKFSQRIVTGKVIYASAQLSIGAIATLGKG